MADTLQQTIDKANAAGTLASTYTNIPFKPLITSPGSNIVADSSTARSSAQAIGESITGAEIQGRQEIDAINALKTSSQNNQDEIQRQRDKLNQSRAEDEALINSLFDQTKAELEQKQKKEFAGRSTQLITAGGYMGTTQSQEGVLANLAQSQRSEIAALTLKKFQAIKDARNAYDDRDFKLADKSLEEAKSLEQEIISTRKNFADQVLAANKEARSAENQIRDDARTTLNSIITNFGGVGLENLSPESRQSLGELADMSGIPRDLIVEGFRTLKEKSLENTQNQREFSQQMAQANLAIRTATLALAQNRDERAGQITELQAQRLGLPKAVVGLTEEQIYSDLQNSEIPQWFVRAEEDKDGVSIKYEDLLDRWNNFRGEAPTSGSNGINIDFSGYPPPIQ